MNHNKVSELKRVSTVFNLVTASIIMLLITSCSPPGDEVGIEVGPLVQNLRAKDPSVRKEAATELARIGTPAVEPLTAALNDEDPNVRKLTADILGEISDSRAIEPLVAILRDAEPSVRERAASALAAIGDTRAVEPLVASVMDPRRPARHEAVKALIRFGISGTEDVLLEVLRMRGDKVMVWYYLESGNNQLVEAGKAWAARNNYQWQSSSKYRNSPTWGEIRN